MEEFSNEKQDSPKFWIDLIREYCEVPNPDKVLDFEVPVKLEDSIGYIDVWIPATKILIEQKSRGKKLDVPERQSDGSFLTPYDQAKRYDNARSVDQKANWIITSNFEELWIYNMRFERPERHILKIPIEELPEWDLRFLTNPQRAEAFSEELISEAAGLIMQDVRDQFFFSIDQKNPDQVLALNKLCIRIVFCLYSEDTGIFPKHLFLDFLEETQQFDSIPIFKQNIAQLFVTLSTPIEKRHFMTSATLMKFPYVDGELFRDDPKDALDSLAFFDSLDENFDMRKTIVEMINASKYFNWSAISPTIFGAIFESIMNPDNRREDGVHFTSPENIHKVIDPLLFDNLNEEFDRCRTSDDLLSLHKKISNMIFFDPACGSGNFLTETYISLRMFEDRILKKIGGEIAVSIENFYGIEINDWAVRIAKLALWISQSQMNGIETFLPLKKNANIIETNSLEIEWDSVVPREKVSFVMGNPPYVGYSTQSSRQKSEMRKIFDGNRASGKMDYVCAWFRKASLYMVGTEIEAGFVATNSVTQGEQVGYLWKPLFEDGIRINFAWKSFKWDNESKDRKHVAKVHCVVVSFARFDRDRKWIFDGGEKISAKNINGYLMDAPDICIESRNESPYDVPKMTIGSCPADDGNLIIEANELEAFLKKDPRAKKFVRRYMMGVEFIHNIPRYCLWLVDAKPNEIRDMKNVLKRVKACKKFRLASKRQPTRDAAKTPWLFVEIHQPTTEKYIALPVVSSERRDYIPIGFLSSDIIAGNTLQTIADGTTLLFGILTSSVYMAWNKIVSGRLKSDYRISQKLAYNNFPFLNLTEKQRKKIEKTAQKILDTRSKYPESSLADLYDPNLMPPDLRKAHEENDRAVLDSYGFPWNITESEIVSRLFEMYEKLTHK